MIAPAILRRRLIAGDTYATIAADRGISENALRLRARGLGVSSSSVLGRHRRRPFITLAEQMRDAVGATLMAEGRA